jgi:8-oxo-dGTP pyrophosphatase MutT (NUDIX family)
MAHSRSSLALNKRAYLEARHMARVINGDRVGRQARLAVGCSATIFDSARQKVLLTRRRDNGTWCVPGGYMEPGETITEACTREVWEETGLHVAIARLVSVYTHPHRILEYADGNRLQLVVLHFEAIPISGALMITNETTAVDYFAPSEIAALDMSPLDRIRTLDALVGRAETIIRDEF